MARRWFQIHLSTAVVLMLCAGGLLWLNVEKRENSDEILKSIGVDFDDELNLSHKRGWPLVFEERLFIPSRTIWKPFALVGNVILNVLVLVAIAGLCEFFLRRREAQSK